MTPKHSKEEMLELLEAAAPAYLATVDAEGFPHTRALFNLHNKDQWPELAETKSSRVCASEFAVTRRVMLTRDTARESPSIKRRTVMRTESA